MKWKSDLVGQLEWMGKITNRNEKEKVAIRMAMRAKNGEVIGVGSGSTVYLTLQALAERIKEEKLQIKVIAASAECVMACIHLGIPQISLWEQRPDWVFDGADEVDPENNLIKGRGAALFKEKLLITGSCETYILVDNSKLVEVLGKGFPVPVEVFPMALSYVADRLEELQASELTLRGASGKDGPVITENGNFILDVRFPAILPGLEKAIKSITGVLECGLFQGYPLQIVKPIDIQNPG